MRACAAYLEMSVRQHARWQRNPVCVRMPSRMDTYDILIKNGMVVTSEGEGLADVAIRGEQVAAVAPALPDAGRETIDASGCYVFPGFIDPHVHLSLPIGRGLVSSDDFGSGTVAAACGGTTTVIDFTAQARGVSLDKAVANRRAEADGRVAIDYSLHLTVTDANDSTLVDVQRLAALGYPSIKLYMTYEGLMVRDEAMLRIMRAAADCGALTLVHAENHDLVSNLTRALLEDGQTGPASHPLSRPPYVEAEATIRAIALARATGASLYIVHVSGADALEPILRARHSEQDVSAETCPHYLLLSDDEYSRPGFEAAKYVMTPPLRSRGNWAALWAALADGSLDVVATDHCPWMYVSQKTAGLSRFDMIPGGIAGVETRAQLIFSEGVAAGRLTLPRFVEIMSTNPARLFGLYPRKGTLVAGSDADVVVFDPRWKGTLRARQLHQHVDYTVFEGWQVKGRPRVTISRGCVVARDGRFVGTLGHGRFVARKR